MNRIEKELTMNNINNIPMFQSDVKMFGHLDYNNNVNNNNVNKQKQQLSKELASLIEDYKNNLLKVRELYFKIEDKAIKEEGYTENEIALLLTRNIKKH